MLAVGMKFALTCKLPRLECVNTHKNAPRNSSDISRQQEYLLHF
jgi:hypothetical protein